MNWTSLSALATTLTAVAAVIALWVAVRQSRRESADRKVAQADTRRAREIQAEGEANRAAERKREAEERERLLAADRHARRIHQATRVIAWVDNVPGAASQRIQLLNHSDAPIFDVRISVYGISRTAAPFHEEAVVPPHHSEHWLTDRTLDERDRVFVDFRDLHGVRWRRVSNGSLAELNPLTGAADWVLLADPLAQAVAGLES